MPSAFAVLQALVVVAAGPATGPPPPAPAARAPETRAFQYSAYEEATIAGALARLGFARDPDPEGKIVESVHTVRLEVVEERDPAPRFLNVFHAVTRARVAEREVLLRPGDVYRRTLADESRRKLAALPQLSLALVFAARGDAPDRTRVVVVTKDVWSLRLNWDAALTSGGLESVSLHPAETNLLGTHQRLGMIFDWLPESYSLGGEYAVPRLRGGHVAASLTAAAILNRGTGAREGSYGGAQVASPLWSTRTRWAWSVGASWLEEVTRLYSDGRVVGFTLAPGGCDLPSRLCVPWAWRTDAAEASVTVTRSFGWAVKHDVVAGFDARTSRYELPDRGSYDPATVAAFEASRVPVGDDRVGPWVQYRTYSTDFLRVLDMETLGLQEDHRLGPQFSLSVNPVLRGLGSTRDLVAVGAGASWTAAIRDGLARVAVESTNEIATRDGEVRDGSTRGAVRLASPRSRAGRLIVDGVVLDRHANRANRATSLGGDSRLRGYPTRFLLGSRALVANVEARSRARQLLNSLQLGGVLFYDAGDAFDRWGDLHLRHAAGFGVRALFPQLDRVVFRVDVGFPLSRPAGVAAANFLATFGQAFSP